MNQQTLQQLQEILRNILGDLKSYRNADSSQKKDEHKEWLGKEVGKLILLAQKPKIATFLQEIYTDEDGAGPTLESRRFNVDPPKTFADFLERAKLDSQFREDNETDIRRLFERMDLHEDPLLSSEYVLAYNSRKVTSLYCLLTKTSNAEDALGTIRKRLGNRANDFLLDRDLEVDWSQDRSRLILKSKGKTVEIKLEEREEETDIFSHQNVAQRPATKEEREAFAKRFSGEVELVDSTLGKISELTVIPQDMSRSELISIIRQFEGKKINIVSRPKEKKTLRIGTVTQSQEEYEAEVIDFLEKAGIKNPKKRINFVYSGAASEQWARDYFLQAKDPKTGNRIFLESPQQHAVWKRNVKMSRAFANDPEMKREKTEYREFNLYFEGGDMRAVGSQLFIGEESFEKGIAQAKEPARFKITLSLPGIEEISIEGSNEWELKREVVDKLKKHFSSLKSSFEYDHEFEDHLEQMIKDKGTTEEFYQIGSREITGEMPSDQEIRRILKEEYEKYFGRELVVVGEGDTEKQAIFHIDMFITFLPNPKGKPTVVIADTTETLDILSSLSPEELDRIEKRMTQSQIKAAHLETDYSSKEDELRQSDLLLSDIYGGIHSYIEELRSGRKLKGLQRRLDATAKWFTDRGYEVSRIPTAITHGEIDAQLLTLGKSKEERSELKNVEEDADRTYK